MVEQQPIQGSGGFSTWKFLSGLLRPFTAPQDEALQDGDLSAKEESRISAAISALKAPSQNCLNDFTRDERDFCKHRGYIENAVAVAAKTPGKWKSISRDVLRADLIYSNPAEKGVLVNALMENPDKRGVEDAIRKIAKSLLVDLRSAHYRTYQFWKEIDADKTVALATLLEVGKAPSPIQANTTSQKIFDGALLGGGNSAYPRGTLLAEVAPTLPITLGTSSVPPGKKPMLSFNGLNLDLEEHSDILKSMADAYNEPFVGVHNARQSGLMGEFLRGYHDALNSRSNPTIDTGRDILLEAAVRGESLNVVAFSHGGGIIAQAVHRTRFVLEKMGWEPEKIQEALSKVNIETYGGASYKYPDGPNYKHFILKSDPVPFYFGVTPFCLSEEEYRQRDAEFKERKDEFFKGLFKFHKALNAWIPNPLKYPGAGAEIIILDEEGIQHEKPHSLDSYLGARMRRDAREKNQGDFGDRAG